MKMPVRTSTLLLTLIGSNFGFVACGGSEDSGGGAGGSGAAGATAIAGNQAIGGNSNVASTGGASNGGGSATATGGAMTAGGDTSGGGVASTGGAYNGGTAAAGGTTGAAGSTSTDPCANNPQAQQTCDSVCALLATLDPPLSCVPADCVGTCNSLYTQMCATGVKACSDQFLAFYQCGVDQPANQWTCFTPMAGISLPIPPSAAGEPCASQYSTLLATVLTNTQCVTALTLP